MITVDRLYVRYDDTNILEDINLNLPTGITCAVIGPSGCGKSTLLNVLAGLQKNYQGLVQINGENPSPKKQTIGFIPQNYGLLPWLTVKENILLGLKIKKEAKQGLPRNLVDNLGLSNLLNRYPNNLSGGQQQRVSLARAFALKADLLLMDEPFSALDYQTRLSVADEIGTIIRKEGKTALLVSHDISEAISLSDRVIVLSGRPARLKKIHTISLSVENRTPMKAREAPEFREYFNQIWKELDVHVA